jgi:23S rRNA (uracil1939-C5)-methyltransferase
VTITDLAGGGRGVGRLDGLVLFVDGALPGETVRVRLCRRRRGYAEASLLEILRRSPERVSPPCPYLPDCGGCDWQHLSARGQSEARRRHVLDVLQRVGGLRDAAVAPTVPAPRAYGYRFRMDFDWGVVRGRAALGLHRRGRAGEVVPLDRCLLAGDTANGVLRFVAREADRRRLTAWDPLRRRGLLRRLSIQEAHGTGEVLVSLETGRGDPVPLAALASGLPRAFPRVVGIVRFERDRDDRPAGTSVLYGRDYLNEVVDEDRFRIPAAAFFQPNPEAAGLARRLAIEALALRPGARLLELYAGVGFMSVAAARRGARLTLLEENREACEAARINLRNAGAADFRVVPGDVARTLPALLGEAWEGILLDPPRTGMAGEVRQAVAAAGASRLVYVSCDPATLARDLGALVRDGGWRLLEVTPVDLFPQTQHVECIAVLGRDGGDRAVEPDHAG